MRKTVRNEIIHAPCTVHDKRRCGFILQTVCHYPVFSFSLILGTIFV